MVPFILFLMTSVGAGQALSPRMGSCVLGGAATSAVPLAHLAEAGGAGCCDGCPCKGSGDCDCPTCSCRSGASVRGERSCGASTKARTTASTKGGACCSECAGGGCPAECCAGGGCKASAESASSNKSCCAGVDTSGS